MTDQVANNTQPNNTPASNPGTTSAPAQDWTSGLNDDLKGYVQNKGFKDPVSVLESYKGLEKLMGVPKDRLLKLPEKDDAPEWNDVYGKLGRPATKDEYKFQVEGLDEGVVDWAKENFHKLGLSQKQAETLLKGYHELNQNKAKQITEEYGSKLKDQEISLKKEWGAAFDQNMLAARKAANQFGVTSEQIDAMEQALGFDGVMKLFNTLGSKIGEHNFVGNNSSQSYGAMTPAQAQAEINSLKADRNFISKFSNGDSEAVNRLNQLHKWAFPSE